MNPPCSMAAPAAHPSPPPGREGLFICGAHAAKLDRSSTRSNS